MAEACNNSSSAAEYADRVKDEFVGVYKDIRDKLSEDAFSDYLELLESDDVHVKTDTAVVLFKTFLLEYLTDSFDRMWRLTGISQSLECMQLLKKRFEDRTEAQWRPYGRSALEQTVPLRLKVLEKRKQFLQELLEQQRVKLEMLVAEVEDNRRLSEEHNIRRNMLSNQIDLRMKKLEVAKEAVAQQIVAAVDKL